MSAPTSRPTFACDFAHVLGARPAPTGPVAPDPADLAGTCNWAIRHATWINGASGTQRWSDMTGSQQVSRYNAVVDRAIAEPTGDFRTIQSKARLCLYEMEDAGEFLEPNPGVRLAAVILREIIAFRT
jgi:hypothetical protein